MNRHRNPSRTPRINTAGPTGRKGTRILGSGWIDNNRPGSSCSSWPSDSVTGAGTVDGATGGTVDPTGSSRTATTPPKISSTALIAAVTCILRRFHRFHALDQPTIAWLALFAVAGIWLISRDGHDLCSDSVGEGCLAVTQPRRRVLTDGRAASNLEEGSPWPS
jgi:hypothetical protein